MTHNLRSLPEGVNPKDEEGANADKQRKDAVDLERAVLCAAAPGHHSVRQVQRELRSIRVSTAGQIWSSRRRRALTAYWKMHPKGRSALYGKEAAQTLELTFARLQ